MSSASNTRSPFPQRPRAAGVPTFQRLAGAMALGLIALTASCETAQEPLVPEDSALSPGQVALSLAPHLEILGRTIHGYLAPGLDIVPTEDGSDVCASWTDPALADGGFDTDFFSFDFFLRDGEASAEAGVTVWTRLASVRGDADGQGACAEFGQDELAGAQTGLDEEGPWLRVDGMARSGKGRSSWVHHTSPFYLVTEASEPDDPDDGASAMIGSEGGQLTLFESSGGIRALLIIPAGALLEETSITILRETDPALDDGSFAVPGTSVVLSPSGLEFETPVSLVLAFDPGTLPLDTDPAELEIHRLNADGSTTVQPTEIDIGEGTATATLSSFSGYVLLAPPPTVLDRVSLWSGGASPDPRDWHDPANWAGAGRVPDRFTPALILADVAHFPRITSPADVASLTIGEGASLDMVGSGISVHGSIISEGTFTSEGGATVTMFGSGTRSLSGALPNLGIQQGTVVLNGNVDVDGRVLLVGNSPTLRIGAHVMEISGELLVAGSDPARILMTETLGRVIVHGDANFTAPWPGEAPLQAGTLELKGNFMQGQAAAFRAAGNHRTLFSGERIQLITIDDADVPGTGFSTLSLGNTSTELMLQSNVRAEFLSWADEGVGARVSGGGALSVRNAALIRGPVSVDELRIGGKLSWSGHPYLVSTTVFTGEGIEILQPQTIPHVPYQNVVVMSDDATLEDEFVTVRGEFRILDGSFRADRGRLLTVMGNLATEGDGGLIMMDDDRIVVYGNVDFQGAVRAPGLDSGRLWIGGDVTGGYGARAGHTTILFGSGTQELMSDGAIAELAITNTGEVGVRVHRNHPVELLNLAGNSRFLEGQEIPVGHANFRNGSRTHFEEGAFFRCGTAWSEGEEVVTSDGLGLGCNALLPESRITDPEGPPRDYFDLPSPLNVQITAPLQGTTVGENQPITFSASASMDGAGVDVTFEWTSSRDGILGTGSTIVVESLSVGVHYVTARAETPDGLVGLDFMVVRVTEPATVNVTPATAEAARLSTLSFTAEVLDEFGGALGNTQVTWSTSNACVASVDEFGTVTTHGGGSVQITASAGSAQGSASLTVEDAPAGIPATVAGQWRVCNAWSGDYVGLLDIEHVEGEENIAGTFTGPSGTYPFMEGISRWFDNRLLTAVWAVQFQGSERLVGINNAEAVNQETLSGTFDPVSGGMYPVQLVRIGGE